MSIANNQIKPQEALKLRICSNRKTIWIISALAVILSLLAFVLSFLRTDIRSPLKPGLDFTGGTQIKLERKCTNKCKSINSFQINKTLIDLVLPRANNTSSPNLSNARFKLADNSQSIILRLPFLSSKQSQEVINILRPIAGPFVDEKQSIDQIGPTLGIKLLKSSSIALLVAFAGIVLYISVRYDRSYAFFALIALFHDILIVSGIFSWLGIFSSIEVDSLFAVSLLTIAGYSVNDTVVVFDRIREKNKDKSLNTLSDKIDSAVSATLTRTLYTSGTTLLPLLALIIFGGPTLYWFAISLALGVLIGSWSSIALAPSLLSLKDSSSQLRNRDQ